MRYRLKLDESVADGVRRIGVGQIDRAARVLNQDDRETGIHEARKCFKRLRALLDMSRPALKKGVYKRENRRFRDLGRMLAGPRDLHVMRQTLDKLAAHRDLSDAGSVPSAVRNWLDGALADTRPVNGDDSMARARTALAQARESFAALPVAADGIKPLMAGLRETYAGGRTAMKDAYRDGLDDEVFHEWRKYVQRHWRHLQLVRPAWPDGLRPRIALASALSEVIGDDHDLGVLADFIARNKVILGPADEAGVLIGHARARQAELRAEAHAQGQRLFALPPKAMSGMLKACWRSAREIEKTRPTPGPADDGNVVRIAGRHGA